MRPGLNTRRLMIGLLIFNAWNAMAAAPSWADDDDDIDLSAPATETVTATSKIVHTTGVHGRIIDGGTRAPVPGARIVAVGLAGGSTLTDADGQYWLDLPAGQRDLRVNGDLYKSRRLRVQVRGWMRLNVRLRSDPHATDELLVEARADRRTETAAIEARKKSDTVQDAVSAQEMSRSPDANAGDAVKRVVSATIVNGKYVFIRGLGGRYSTTLLNGVVLPSPDPDQAAVPLDIFPAGLLANLTVVKSYTPDLPGTFAGGVLKIESNSYPSEFELKFKAGVGWDSETTGRTRMAYASGPTDWLSFDGGHRALPDSVPKDGPLRDDSGTLDAAKIEAIAKSFKNVWNVQPTTALPNLTFSAQVGDTVSKGTRKLGYMLATNYGRKETRQFGEVSSVRLEDGVLGVREKLAANIGTTTTAIGGLASVGLEWNAQHAFRLLSLYTRSAEDRTQVVTGFSESDNQDVDSRRLQFVTRALSFTQLVGEHRLHRHFALDWQGNVSKVWRDEPDTRDLLYHILPSGGSRFQNGPGSGERFFSGLEDLSGGGGLNLKFESERFQVSGGGLVQQTQRTFGARRFRFTYVGSDPEVLLTDAETMLAPGHIGPDFRMEERTLMADSYAARQQLWGGYVKADWQIAAMLRVIGGLRYETQSQVLSPGSIYSISSVAEAGINRSDDHYLPAVNVVLALTPEMNLRAGYSYTLARPQLRELAPFLFFDFARRRSVSGNPLLRDTRIHNADLRWEMFFSEKELFAASVFFKQFRDPIEAIIVNVGQGDVSYANALGAQGLGLELEGRVALGRFAKPLAGVRVGANLTLVRSEVDLGDTAPSQTNQHRPLQGQSPFVINTDISWSVTPELDLSLLYNVFGARLAEVGIEGLPDVYEQSFHRLDLAASYAVGHGMRLKVSAANLLFGSVVLEQGDIIVQRFPLGLTSGISLEWAR